MAKANFEEEDKIYPRGILILTKSMIMPNGLSYNKIYASYWDLILRDSNLLKNKKEITPKDWIWHAFKDDICVFHISGDNVVQIILEPNLDEIEKEKVYVV